MAARRSCVLYDVERNPDTLENWERRDEAEMGLVVMAARTEKITKCAVLLGHPDKILAEPETLDRIDRGGDEALLEHRPPGKEQIRGGVSRFTWLENAGNRSERYFT